MMYIHYSSDSKTVQLTCLASCSPSHHVSCPFPGYMMTQALVFVFKYPSCTTITFCSSSVRVNHPSWVMKSKTWIDCPWPFLRSGCWPSGTHPVLILICMENTLILKNRNVLLSHEYWWYRLHNITVIFMYEPSYDSVRVHPRLGAYMMSGYLWSSDISTRGHSRGMGPCWMPE